MTQPDDQASILAQTARGAGWVVAWRMATRSLGLVSTLVLVRLLAPDDFGLVALGSSFAVSIEAFSWIGVEEGVIRHAAPGRPVYDTAFTLAVLRGTIIGLVIAAAAWPGAAFFGDPRLVNVILALAFAAFLEGLVNIGVVDFRRGFAFHNEFRLFLLPRIASIVLAIAAAFVLRSYWALIIGITSKWVLQVALSYVLHPHRPRLTLVAWRELTGYSAWNSAIAALGVIRDRADSLLIGRLLNTTQVGWYAVGYEIAELPANELIAPLTRAAFSGFAAAQRQQADAGQTWLRLVAAMALLTLPAGVGVSALAAPVVALAFGAGWAPAVPVMQVLGLAFCLGVFGMVSQTMFQAQGQMRTSLSIIVVGLVLRVALLAVLVPALGLTGGAIGAGLAMAAEQSLSARFALRRLHLSFWRDLMPRLWRCLLATAAMAAILWASGLGWAPAHGQGAPLLLLWLLGGAGSGAAIYGAVLLAFWLLRGRPDGPEADLLRLIRRR